ncbi:MAG: hypothetical protein HYX25_05045 [Candidatus Solibacter usitatus]|nr:hypothetical protein [Candidatus Solibacter usitatus]
MTERERRLIRAREIANAETDVLNIEREWQALDTGDAALKVFLARKAGRRLAALGGTQPAIRLVRRRRSKQSGAAP